MDTSLRHIAIFVSDLRTAEHYYQTVFDMELIGRESELADGLWYTLPFDKGWEDAKAAGMDLGMSALRKGKFVLALFSGSNPPGQVFAIGLSATEEEIKAIHERLSPDIKIEEFQADRLEFLDPYHITWQIAVEPTFRTAGDFANRWLVISKEKP